MPEKLAELAGGADGHVAASDGWHELAVANPTFLLERLGSECTDVQGLRELTVNGLDAIAALGADRNGRVVWDLDWERFDASGGRVRKLSVIDTGTGMTAGQLRYYINQLAASGREQSLTGDFGVGAKVAAGSRNPHGLEYRSWHQGQGSLVCFKRHPDGRWGLEPQRWADGRTDFWRPLGEAEKPWLLRGEDHGTQVVLLGQDERHDTTQTPQSVTDARGNGSRATSTAASCGSRRGSRCWCARISAAASRGSCGGSTASATTSTAARSRRVGGAERRACALVGARRRSSRPASRSRRMGFDRSRRRGLRRWSATMYCRRPGPPAPSGLRHPLRL